jgi:hypothetical protein
MVADVLRAIRRTGYGNAEELIVVGRKSAKVRRLLITVVERDGNLYAGHPNGSRGHWVRNLEAAARRRFVRDATATSWFAPNCCRRASSERARSTT